MKSMTGYGRGEWAQGGVKVSVEVSSVNRKQSEIAVNLPRQLEVLEAQVRDSINRKIARGRVTVRVAMHHGEGKGPAPFRLNPEVARSYLRQLRLLARQLKIDEAVTLSQLLAAPGVVESAEELVDPLDFWPAVDHALERAMKGLLQMRAREGDHLARDLAERMKIIQKSARRIQQQAPRVQVRYREQLVEKIKAAGLEVPGLDDERLLKEVVYFADRADISEEITRLQSHFKQFEDCRKSSEPVGRTLDFLAQEMNREINTIGSKANDALISREVVVIKAELERFREQAQNVE